MGEVYHRPEKELAKAKELVAQASQTVAKKVREGTVAQRDIRSQVVAETFAHAGRSKAKPSPLFTAFG